MALSTSGQKFLMVAGLVLVSLATIGVLRTKRLERDASVEQKDESPRSLDQGSAKGKDPRLILGRVWLDRLPRSRKDDVDVWLFFGGGLGLEDKGSRYLSTTEFFDFERRGDKVDILFLQDGKRVTQAFEIVACDDKPPFDLCLELKEPLRGQKRLYSWGDDSDMDAAVPWARSMRVAAEARTRTVR